MLFLITYSKMEMEKSVFEGFIRLGVSKHYPFKFLKNVLCIKLK